MGRIGSSRGWATLLGVALCASSADALASSCYEPTWNPLRAARISFQDGSAVSFEVRVAHENSSEASLLLVKGDTADYSCVTVGPRVRTVQYPIQRAAHVDAIPLARTHLVAISGDYSGGSACCHLLQFLTIDPATGATRSAPHGGFVLPNLARYRYGVAKSGSLMLLTAAPLMADEDHPAGPHRYRLTRYRYVEGHGGFIESTHRTSTHPYDLAATGEDIFVSENAGLDP